jgi:secreted PhoX family phosphatase
MNTFSNRREFLLFMGYGMASAAALSQLSGCATQPSGEPLPFTPLKFSTKDDLVLADGFRYDIFLRWRQPLNTRGEKFGFNNDFLAYVPFDRENPLEGLLWVNHEYHDPYFNSGWRPGQARTRKQCDIERKEVGGSIVHIKRGPQRWELVENSKYNRRLDGFTKIPFASERPIRGEKFAIGTFANCAGGITPWGSVLTCEENYDHFVGEVQFINGKRKMIEGDPYLTWQHHWKVPPEHYGWVTEVDLKTGKAKKLTALGRFTHECATTTTAKDGRAVVYLADDRENEHLYKFISTEPGSLDKGELFVADTINGRWMSLDREKNQRLKSAFKDQTELLIRAREAAKTVGATKLDRPEDIEIHPVTKAVFVALTMNKPAGRPFGSLLKLEEKNSDPLSLEFTASTFKAGGPGQGFSCPDNLEFDANGNLWMCSDISGSSAGRAPYTEFGNNGLFYIPMSGSHAGEIMQVASAPAGAEFTGPRFMPDGTLLLSVQHPGERAHDPKYRPSHWPDGGDKEPVPCVVQISGPVLQKLIKG